MINIQIRNSDLIIEDSTKEIFNWKHRAFFNISMGFEVDEEKNCYFYSEKIEFQDAVKEIISYLKEEEVEFTPTKQGKLNTIATTTGIMINAGNYKVRLTSKDAEGVSVNSLDVQ